MITVTELREWAGITASDPGTVSGITEAVNAANSLVGRRCVPMTDPWPPEVHTAALVQAARLYKRRGSPEGFSGVGDFGPVRVAAWDPDIEANLAPYLRVAFA